MVFKTSQRPFGKYLRHNHSFTFDHLLTFFVDISCSGISFPLLANNYNEVNPARVNTNMSSVMRLEGGLNKRKRNMEHHTIKVSQKTLALSYPLSNSANQIA